MTPFTPQGHAYETYYGSPEKLQKYRNAGRCSSLWEKSEMGKQRKIGSGIKTQSWQVCRESHKALPKVGTMLASGSLCHQLRNP